MINKRLLGLLLSLGLLIGGVSLTSGCDAVCAPQNVSFQKCIVPTMEANCSGAGCHGGTEPAYALQLEKDHYANMVGTYDNPKMSAFQFEMRMIEPGKPEKSVLYLKMLKSEFAKIGGEAMPLKRGYLSESQMEMIKVWIQEGAKNN